MTAHGPVLQIRDVSKQYSGLRPLRISELSVDAGERVSIGALDAGAGELLVNLVTGASLPDQGDVHVFGQRTADIANGDAWLDLLERFGIVSPRGVLLEGSTLLQNLAMPFTLAIDPVSGDVASRVEA
jgi:ABC-type transporter Mla maintaining outer membrane lipid asymmetry ATPase subunit MlaF